MLRSSECSMLCTTALLLVDMITKSVRPDLASPAPNLTGKSIFIWVRVWEKFGFLVWVRGMFIPAPHPHPPRTRFLKFTLLLLYNILLLFRNMFIIIILLFWKKFIRSLIINIIIVFVAIKKGKKNTFFKYFIKNRVFMGGGGTEPGDPSQLKVGLDVQFLPLI